MLLSDELRRAREYLNGANPPPSNEANTCNWVIWPLLLACGYLPYDIHAQGHDPAGKIPDYTILPNSTHTWFLEAKTWQEDIKDAHIAQASNYANAQGKRWFVVTNGRDWRLYDDHITGVLPQDRLVAAARIDCDGELETLLDALSKNSVMTGNLKTFARKFRLNDILTQQMADARSEIFSAITSLIKRKPGLHDVTAAEIMAHFQKTATVSKPILPAAITTLLPVTPIAAPTRAAAPATQFTNKDLSLPELKQANSKIGGGKPVLLTLPDATTKSISNWRDMTMGIIEWLFEHDKQPAMPFAGQKGGERCFINVQPLHPNGWDMQHKTLSVKGQAFYVSVNRSGPDFVRMLHALCLEVGEAAEGFRVKLK